MTKRRTEPLLPMTQALSQLQADGNIKASAFHFLRMDFSKLATENDFRKAYAGLAAAEQLLGPLDKRYCYALSGMRKTLDRFVDTLQPDNSALEKLVNSYHSIFKKMGEYWETVLMLVKPHVPADIYEELQEDGREMFGRKY